jgi:hypothetical protein
LEENHVALHQHETHGRGARVGRTERETNRDADRQACQHQGLVGRRRTHQQQRIVPHQGAQQRTHQLLPARARHVRRRCVPFSPIPAADYGGVVVVAAVVAATGV